MAAVPEINAVSDIQHNGKKIVIARPRQRAKQFANGLPRRICDAARKDGWGAARVPMPARDCFTSFAVAIFWLFFNKIGKKSRICEGFSPKQSRDWSAQVPIFARKNRKRGETAPFSKSANRLTVNPSDSVQIIIITLFDSCSQSDRKTSGFAMLNR